MGAYTDMLRKRLRRPLSPETVALLKKKIAQRYKDQVLEDAYRNLGAPGKPENTEGTP